MGPINPADLTDKVRFERRAESDDGYGNTEAGWTVLVAERSVRLRPTRGGEQVIAARAQGVAAYDLWVRRDSGTLSVEVGDRAVDARDDRRTFNIKFIGDMDGRRTWLLMQLELGTADG